MKNVLIQTQGYETFVIPQLTEHEILTTCTHTLTLCMMGNFSGLFDLC